MLARRLLIALSTAALAAATLSATAMAPASAGDLPSGPAAIRAAVDATRATERFDFSVASRVRTTAIKATGRVDLPASRTAVQVTVGGRSTEFRRIGTVHYVDARQLGSTGQQWVTMGPSSGSRQMSVRSVTSLVSTLSPQPMLAFLKTVTSARMVGRDAYGTRYRIASPQSRVAFLPMITTFGTPAPGVGPTSQVDVWIDAHGRIDRAQVNGYGFASVFSLSGFGSAGAIATPPASATGGLQSASGQFLFGSGQLLPSRPATAPTLIAAPTVVLVDGIVQGRINATSSTNQQLRFAAAPGSRGGKLSIGTVPGSPSDPQNFTALPYGTWLDGQSKGLETFNVRVREVTAVDRYLTGIRLIGLIASPVIELLQDMPQVNLQFAYIIGITTLAPIAVQVGELAPDETPVAFTTHVAGYRQTPISINFFPASGLAAGQTAYLALQGSALGARGNINPYQTFDTASLSAGTSVLRSNGFNVITWDPRGSYASGGTMQLNDPFFEGVDMSAIITWAAGQSSVVLNGPGDPAVGMVGGSYGGGIQLVTASTDPRLDGIVPGATWNSLIESLQPNGVLNTTAASSLLRTLTKPEIRLDPALRAGLQDGITTGRLSSSTLTLLASKNLNPLLSQLQAPTLLWQSTSDPLFPVTESLTTAQRILSNPYGVPTKVAWLNGSAFTSEDATTVASQSVIWLNAYVKGMPLPIDLLVPDFQWWDQGDQRHSSPLLPFEDGFAAGDLTASSAGGSIRITPAGSAPGPRITVQIPVPDGAEVVGTPTLQFTYRGTGSARAVYAQVLDASDGAPLGPVSLVPVVLDGRSRTVALALNGVSFTGLSGSAVRVVISGVIPAGGVAATGTLTVSNVTAAVPQHATN